MTALTSYLHCTTGEGMKFEPLSAVIPLSFPEQECNE